MSRFDAVNLIRLFDFYLAAMFVLGLSRRYPVYWDAIRLTIGDTYRSLGKYKQAQPHLERSLALRQQNLRPDHPGTLSSKHNLAALYQAQGKYDHAEPLLREVLKLREKKLGPHHTHTLQSKNNLAALYWSVNKLDQSILLLQQLLQ